MLPIYSNERSAEAVTPEKRAVIMGKNAWRDGLIVPKDWTILGREIPHSPAGLPAKW
jgi:hypothetical protein